MKPANYKRIIAYVFDVFLVTILSTLLTVNFYDNQKYEEVLNEYTNLISDFTTEETSQEEFLTKTNDLVYTLNKESLVVTIVTVVLTTVYFVVVPYFMNGQTLGKKFMKLQIVSENEKPLTMNHYLIRALFINSILMNVLDILFILFLKKKVYFIANDISTYFFGAVYIVSIGMILFREDRRGLHDFLGRTRVISTKSPMEIVPDKKEIKEDKIKTIKEAEIIEKKA